MLHEMLKKVTISTKTEGLQGSKIGASEADSEQFLGLFAEALSVSKSAKKPQGINAQIKNLHIENQLSEVQNLLLSHQVLSKAQNTAMSILNGTKAGLNSTVKNSNSALKELLLEAKQAIEESKLNVKDDKSKRNKEVRQSDLKTLQDVIKKAEELGLKPSAIHGESDGKQVLETPASVAIKKATKEVEKDSEDVSKPKQKLVQNLPRDKIINDAIKVEKKDHVAKESKAEQGVQKGQVANSEQKSEKVAYKDMPKVAQSSQKLELKPDIIVDAEPKKAQEQIINQASSNASLVGILNITKDKKPVKTEATAQKVKAQESSVDSRSQEFKEPKELKVAIKDTHKATVLEPLNAKMQSVASMEPTTINEKTKRAEAQSLKEVQNLQSLIAKKSEKSEKIDEGEKPKKEAQTIERGLFITSSEIRNEILNRSVAAKETIRNFTHTLKEEVQNYKPPLTKLSIELNPENLGSVELTITQRGQNLLVQVTSNPQAIQLFMNNTTEFRQQLSNVGFSDVAMSFSDSSGSGSGFNGQNHSGHEQKGNENSLYAYKTNALGIEEESLSSKMEIILPKYA